MRSGVTDFGITTLPSCRCQRMTTWPGVLPCSAAIAVIAGSSSTAPWASGLHASVTMPRSSCSRAQAGLLEARVQLDLVDGRGHAGLVDDPARGASGWKFETPIARTRPSACSSMNAFHVST